MQTKIGDKMYITKFFYGKAKNPNSKGRWRNRKTECVIFEMVSPSVIKDGIVITPAELKEVYRGVTQNRHGEQFYKPVGRRLAFLKAIDLLDNNVRREFIASFEEQCSSSAENHVRVYTQDLLESIRQG